MLYQPDGDGKSFVPLSGYWCYWETQKYILCLVRFPYSKTILKNFCLLVASKDIKTNFQEEPLDHIIAMHSSFVLNLYAK